MKAIVAITVCLMVFSCSQVDMTAPQGASLALTAQPQSISSNGNASLTVTGTRDNGAPLPDGSVIRFSIDGNLGSITPNPVETSNGVATAKFLAGQRSGTATLKAFSGDAESNEVDITIGEAAVDRLILTADPSSLPVGGGKIQLKAYAVDDSGNPVSGVRVFFASTSGKLSSRGSAVTTNLSGVARDTLNTDSDATITASVSGASDSSLTIPVGVAVAPTCGAVASPSSALVGERVFFTDTSVDPDGRIISFSWDFGDGRGSGGATASHSYGVAGTYVVVHSTVDDQGLTDVCAPLTVVIGQGSGPQCSFVVSPSGTVDVGQQVTFADTSTDSDGNVVQFVWDFGDGETATGQTVMHSYSSSGTFLVQHSITDDQGLSGNCTPVSVTVGETTAPPTCSFTFNTPTASFITSFDASASTDNDEGGASIVSYQWDFGDGQSTTTSNPNVSHDYSSAGAGTYSASVTVVDDEGETSSCPAQSVTIPGT